MCFGYSKELFHCHGSFEYPQCMFSLRNTKNNFQVHTLSGDLIFVHFSNKVLQGVWGKKGIFSEEQLNRSKIYGTNVRAISGIKDFFIHFGKHINDNLSA